MKLLGLIPEPPFDPLSWSGSSSFFFRSLQQLGILDEAHQVKTSRAIEMLQKLRSFDPHLARWREQYHSSVSRFESLTRVAAAQIERYPNVDGVLQVGAWFSAPLITNLPCFSYHDGNAALWYRYYGRGLLSESRIRKHLDWERANYSRMRGVFVMSQWLADSFSRDFGVPEHRLHVVGAGINFEHLPERVNRDYSTPRFLLIGRDFVRKGGRFLLEAFREVRQSVPSAELTIVGPEPGPVAPGVRYTGYLDKGVPSDLRKLNQILQTATVMVLPSVYEPFGISLLEGMANGMPCIAVDRCAMPEIVVHGQTGLIAGPEDSASLAKAMIELATNPELAMWMGEQGRLRVEERFTWDAVARKIQSSLLESEAIE